MFFFLFFPFKTRVEIFNQNLLKVVLIITLLGRSLYLLSCIWINNVDGIGIAGIAQCPQEIQLYSGQVFSPPVTVNRSIHPTCFLCLTEFGRPSSQLIFCQINGKRLPFNSAIMVTYHIVSVSDLSQLPLMDGRNNEMSCLSRNGRTCRRVLNTLSKQCN